MAIILMACVPQGQKALYDLAKSGELGDAPDIMALDAQIAVAPRLIGVVAS